METVRLRKVMLEDDPAENKGELPGSEVTIEGNRSEEKGDMSKKVRLRLYILRF